MGKTIFIFQRLFTKKNLYFSLKRVVNFAATSMYIYIHEYVLISTIEYFITNIIDPNPDAMATMLEQIDQSRAEWTC